MEENEARHGRALRRTAVHPETSTTGRPTKWHGLAVLVGTTVPGGAVSGPRSFAFSRPRPLFDSILAHVWSLFLVHFMLNLVDLGSNYLPSIHIVPKFRFVFILGEIIGFRWKRGLQKWFQGRLENQGSSKHQEEQNGGKRGKSWPRIKAHSRAPRNQHDRPASKVARPGRAGWHDRARGCHVGAAQFRIFSVFLFRFCFIFWDLSLEFFESSFRINLGFSLGLNKLH